MTKKERLHIFAELACCRRDGVAFWTDPSDPDNIRAAEKWLQQELTFLNGRDADELREVWAKVISDCRDARMLFSAVKELQVKYG